MASRIQSSSVRASSVLEVTFYVFIPQSDIILPLFASDINLALYKSVIIQLIFSYSLDILLTSALTCCISLKLQVIALFCVDLINVMTSLVPFLDQVIILVTITAATATFFCVARWVIIDSVFNYNILTLQSRQQFSLNTSCNRVHRFTNHNK